MLHPQARALLDLIEKSGLPPTHMLSPADARRFYRDRRAYTQPDPPEVGAVRDLRAPGPHGDVPLRLYRPLGCRPEAILPVLVYFHGGGCVIGDLDTHDTLCRTLANDAGICVISVDYRLAPEHRFPVPVDDCLAATRWIAANAAALGVDAARLAVGGDSAGGNLAAVVSIAARDAGDLPIRHQLLIYPVTDLRRDAPSHTSNGQGYLLTRESIAYFYDQHYVPDRAQHLDWRVSPLLAASLEALPPALVITAGYDPLRDEGRHYAEALTAAGNSAVYVCFERQIHGFITMGRVFDDASVAVRMCAAELRRALGA